MNASWRVLDPGDPSLGVVERIRRQRGLDQTFECSHEPFLLPDMQEAVSRIQRAIRDKERVLIFGDYDADGITGSCLMFRCLKALGAWVGVRLPHREHDGYGLHVAQVERAAEDGVKLLVTVDNGTTALEALARARELKLDLIVLDHHTPHGGVPDCTALVNPHRGDSKYPERNLAAVGIVFKMCQALGWRDAGQHLDLVALGTVADMAPLQGENRWLVKEGLKCLERGGNPGLRELIEFAPRKEINSRLLGWQLGPRINSAGRLADANQALKLLLCDSRQEAREQARELDELNLRRRALQEEALNEARQVLESAQKVPPVLMLCGQDWHPGIVGLVAGRLSQEYARPAVILTRALQDGSIRGSARSLPGYHITDAFARHSKLLTEFGGHAEAAGLTLPVEHFKDFARILTLDAMEYKDSMHLPALEVDTLVEAGELELPLVRELDALEPFGMANPEVLLGMEDLEIERQFQMSGGKHLKLWLRSAGRRLEAVWWKHSGLPDGMGYQHRLDVVFRPSVNTWQGKNELQLVVEDVAPAGKLAEAMV